MSRDIAAATLANLINITYLAAVYNIHTYIYTSLLMLSRTTNLYNRACKDSSYPPFCLIFDQGEW